MDPGTASLIGAGLNFLGGGLFGGGQQQAQGNLHLVNPAQQLLYNKMIAGLTGGAGDFGYGSNIKQGTSQLQNMMAQRGIKVGSGGAYSGAYGNMVGQALGADAQARRQYALNLLQSPLQTATVTGGNLIPGSPSAGWSSGAQEGSWNSFGQRGYLGRTTGDFNFGSPGSREAQAAYARANPEQFGMAPAGGSSLADRTLFALRNRNRM